MIKVKILRRGRYAGQIDFHGIRAMNGDAKHRQVNFTFQCYPPGLVPEDTARRIACDLSNGLSHGKIGADEWRVG